MQFTSLGFIIFFLLTAFIFYILPKQILRIVLLLLASTLFYAFYKPEYIVIIFLIVLIDFFSGLFLDRAKSKKNRKVLLIVGITLNLLLLCYFKYFNFLIGSVVDVGHIFNSSIKFEPISLLLPLGISFHTFQGLSYLVEIYKKRYKPERNIVTFSLYILFFPQLAAGPIERPQALLPQFKIKQSFDQVEAASGFRLILWGMFKKLLIADRIAVFINPIFASPSSFSGFSLLLATFLFGYQIYCDFSGYTDIARGTARVFGIKLVKNFNHPYASSSPAEFWNRWHISLYSWFRDYIYIPLGGSRVSSLKKYRNIFIVFALSGLWHGAAWHFVVWGILNGFYVACATFLRNRTYEISFPGKRLISIALTFVLIQMTWIFFRANTIQDAWQILRSIFSSITQLSSAWEGLQAGFVSVFSKEATFGQATIVLSLIVFLELFQYALRNTPMALWFQKLPLPVRWASYYVILLLIMSLGVDIPNVNFIYFTF